MGRLAAANGCDEEECLTSGWTCDMDAGSGSVPEQGTHTGCQPLGCSRLLKCYLPCLAQKIPSLAVGK